MAESEFQLDVSVPDSRDGAAAFYGVATKTVSRWKAMGVAANDPCPWKTPALMPEWWRRVAKKPVPECFASAIAKTTPRQAAQAAGAAPSETRRVLFRDDSAPGEEGGLLTRLKSDEERLHRRYRDAIQQELDDTTIRQYREHWQEAADMLDMHLSRVKKRGEMADPREYDAAFERFIAPLPETLFRSFPKEPPAEKSWADTVREAIRQALRQLPETIEKMLAA